MCKRSLIGCGMTDPILTETTSTVRGSWDGKYGCVETGGENEKNSIAPETGSEPKGQEQNRT